MARPELVFGLVAPVGTDAESVRGALRNALTAVGYRTHVVKLSEKLRDIAPYRDLPTGHRDEYLRLHMEAGNDLCRRTTVHAMALLAALSIRNLRQALFGGEPGEAVAYIVHQLKRPQEVEALRQIYRERFYLIGTHTPRARRVANLTADIAKDHGSSAFHEFEQEALSLIDIDESESSRGVVTGQNVRETFVLADFFVNGSSAETLADDMRRVIELVFNHPFRTPSRDEMGMFLAYGASRRSGDLSRQVGAAIFNSEGSVLAVGANEVPRAGGGAYWADDSPDGRDWVGGHDESYGRRTLMMIDVVKRLEQIGWLRDGFSEDASLEERVREALEADGLLRDSQMMDVIEFGRSVHAEMLALTDAARRGVTVQDAIMYSTTFPCHICARHIVWSGIRHLVYVEPYPKSLVEPLFSDSIVVDPIGPAGATHVTFRPFTGVGPYAFMGLFDAPKRKTGSGIAVPWEPEKAMPKLVVAGDLYIGQEEIAVSEFEKVLRGLNGELEDGLEAAN